FPQAPRHYYGLPALEQTQPSLWSPFLDNDLVRMIFRAPESTFMNNDLRLRLIADGDAALGRIPTDRGLRGGPRRHSATPSRGLLEFLFRAEYAYDYGMAHWLARMDPLRAFFGLECRFLGKHR